MTRLMPTVRAQVRHLSASQVAIDAAMAAVVGLLSALVLLLASQVAFDTLSFEARLDYVARQAVDQPDGSGLTVTAISGPALLSAATHDTAEREHGDLTQSEQPTYWLYPAAARNELQNLVSSNVTSGYVGAHNALLDEATAARLNVTIGDAVVIVADSGSCRVPVSGITRPFRDIDGGLRNGLLVIPDGACNLISHMSAETPSETIRYSTSQMATTRTDRLYQLALRLTDTQFTGLLVPVLAVGLTLWLLVMVRASRRVHSQLVATNDVLRDLGCPSRPLRFGHLAVISLLIGASSLGAAFGARQLLWSVTGIYMQSTHWLTVAGMFAITALFASVLSVRTLDRGARRRPILEPDTVTPGAS